MGGNDWGEDDMSSGDSAGDYCDEYYGNEGWCGNYDTSDFDSYDQCCACQGGGWSDSESWSDDGWCNDDMSYGDSAGDYCDEYYDNPNWCGNYDTEYFNSLDMC